MKIRDYAKSIGFEVVGKLTYMGKRGLAHRWYMDEAGNKYFINICIDNIEIVSSKTGGQKMANEKRLIDANTFGIPKGFFNDGINVPKILDLVAKQPTVDAVEVVHGRWVNPYINRYGHPCHCCSECGFKASYQDKNYCPNCGAKMDGGENNE